MTTTVFHWNWPAEGRRGPTPPPFTMKPGLDYTPVALVNTQDPDIAFRDTNTIESPWWQNRGVTTLGDAQGYRSTSVGDVLVSSAGAYRVEPSGFTLLVL